MSVFLKPKFSVSKLKFTKVCPLTVIEGAVVMVESEWFNHNGRNTSSETCIRRGDWFYYIGKEELPFIRIESEFISSCLLVEQEVKEKETQND